jgi:hypothetical protein
MTDIIIPIPKIQLSEIVQRKAEEAIERHLSRHDLNDISHHLPGYRGKLITEIEEDYFEIKGDNYRMLFISQLLIYLSGLFEEVAPTAFSSSVKTIYNRIKAVFAKKARQTRIWL